MATFTVTSSADSGAGSLREAVALANASAGHDTITFAASFNGEAADLIRLTSGQIVITDALTITGGPQGVRITGDKDGDDVLDRHGYTDVAASLAAGADRLSDNSRIFAITGAASATTLENLQITGGRTTAGNAIGSPNVNGGGAINSEAALTLRNTEVSGNSTSGDRASGGGIAGTSLVLEGSTIAGNVTTGNSADGGGFFVSGSASLTNSTLAGNWVSGRLANSGAGRADSMTLLHATVTANANYSPSFSASEGIIPEGGISADSGTITNSIVSGNVSAVGSFGRAQTGGNGIVAPSDIYVFDVPGFTITGSLVGSNPAVTTVFGTSFVGSPPAEIFAATVVPPRTVTWYSAGLEGGALDAHGGLVRTVGIAPGSSAQDIGVPTVLATDQLGNPRTSGAAPDAGAREIRDAPSLVVTTARDVVDGADGLTSLREAVHYANAKAGADRITFDQAVFNGEAADVIRLVHGQIDITDELVIDGGPGRPVITGDAAGDDVLTAGGLTDIEASHKEGTLADNDRLFFVAGSAGQAELANLTLTGGYTQTRFTAANSYTGREAIPLSLDTSGGAVWTLSDLTLTSVTAAGNLSWRNGAISGGDLVRPTSGPTGLPTPGTFITVDLTIIGSLIERNFGGLNNRAVVDTFGNITMADSIVRDNRGNGLQAGGGIYQQSTGPEGGAIEVTGSLIAGNRMFALSGRDVTIIGSTILDNGSPRPENGGGDRNTEAGRPSVGPVFMVFGQESVTLVNSTVVGNRTEANGITIATDTDVVLGTNPVTGAPTAREVLLGSVTLIGSTVTGNAGEDSGGIRAATVTLTDSIVVANRTLRDPLGGGIQADVLTNNNSIIGTDGTGIFAVTEASLGLNAGVAADNGGALPTVALLPWAWNPAIDTAGPDAPATDQRGAPRQDLLPGGGVADSGAFELQGAISLVGLEARSLVVTTADDVLDAQDGETSLREAILYANAKPGHDTITFDGMVFDGAAADVIRLTRGTLTIEDSLTISGGAAGVRISGDALGNDVLDAEGFTAIAASRTAGVLADNARVMLISAAADTVQLERLQITGGVANTESGFLGQPGGGILSRASLLTLVDSEVSGNASGVLYLGGNRFTFSGFDGGGIWARDLTLNRTTIAGNFGNGGSGVDVNGVATITDSTFAFNEGVGARFAAPEADTVPATDSFLATVSGSTFTGNYKPFSTSGSVTVSNSIFAGNATPPSAVSLSSANSIVTGDGRPVFATTTEVADGVFAGVLADNGGLTRTVALKEDASNPAIRAADPATASSTDQRGEARGASPDIGAFQASDLPSLVVTTLADVVDAFDGETSLREAIAFANGKAGTDTITFAAGLNGAIHLGTAGQLVITQGLTLDGDGRITVDANADGDADAATKATTGNRRAFDITGATAVTFDGVGITGGRAALENGGGVRGYSASLTFIDSTVSGNVTSEAGGGAMAATITATRSTFSDNVAGFGGGGIYASGNLTLLASTVSGNRLDPLVSFGYGTGYGGGALARGNASVTNSTIAWNLVDGRNLGGNGSGIQADGTLMLANSTVTGNAFGNGTGRIYLGGGGVHSVGGTTLVNSILVGNVAVDIEGSTSRDIAFGFGGGSIIGDGASLVGLSQRPIGGAGAATAQAAAIFAETAQVAPGLLAGVLADNGGPTRTVALKANASNPALGAANTATAPGTDQRGEARSGAPDLGAYELVNPAPVANPDSGSLLGDTVATIDVLANDSDAVGGLVAASVRIVGAPGDGRSLDVAGEGSWTVNATTGAITFSPEAGFTGLATAISYTVEDAVGLVSAAAAVTATATGLRLVGTGGADALAGSDRADTLSGGSGNDTVTGAAGHDSLRGDAGDDLLRGGAGADTLRGDAGLNSLFGDGGDDVLLGGAEGDELHGDAGRDTLRGGGGADFVTGGTDADLLVGGNGEDWLEGGDASDRLIGEDGNDTALGGAGADTLIGGGGADSLTGGADADQLYGGIGADSLSGGAGDDTLRSETDAGALWGDEGHDLLFGWSANDTLRGGADNDTLRGYAGEDELSGDDGRDLVTAGGGRDTVAGGNGDDTLFGETDDDLLIGGSGADTIHGGGGADTLGGGAGADTLTGGTGADIFVYGAAEEGGDRLWAFSTAEDQIAVSALGFGGGLVAGAALVDGVSFIASATGAVAAGVSTGQFLYQTTTRALSWDADGDGLGGAVLIARTGVAITSADITVIA